MFEDNVSIHVTRPTQARTQNVFLSQTIFHRRVSIAFATILRVTYKNIRNPNGLSNCMSEQLDVIINVSDFLHSH
jgi:hypothetical protein